MSHLCRFSVVPVFFLSASLLAGPTASFDSPELPVLASAGDLQSYLSSVFGQSVTVDGFQGVFSGFPLSGDGLGDNWIGSTSAGLTLTFSSGISGELTLDYMLAQNGLFNAAAFDSAGNQVGTFSANGFSGGTGSGSMWLTGTAHSVRFFDSGFWSVGLDNLGLNPPLASTPVPEPATLALFGVGLGGAGFARWVRRKRGPAA